MRRRRPHWKKDQGRIDPRRLVFIDEPWAKTTMTRLHRRWRRDDRLVAKVPHRRWRTLTFLAALHWEPRLSSATRWYVTADPGEIDGLEFAYLSGNQGPRVESRSGWDVDGVEIRVILDFGAGFVDHRGWFMNPGA